MDAVSKKKLKKPAKLTGIARYDILLFSRSLEDLERLVLPLGKPIHTGIGFPKQILWPADIVSNIPTGHRSVMMEFLDVLERFLGTKAKSVDIADSWVSWAKDHSRETDLQKYMKDVSSEGFFVGNFANRHSQAVSFVSFIHVPTLHGGFRGRLYPRVWQRTVFRTNPEASNVRCHVTTHIFLSNPFFRRDTGKNVTKRDAIWQSNSILSFRIWFDEHIMRNVVHSGDAIMVLPCDAPGVRYRDEPAG